MIKRKALLLIFTISFFNNSGATNNDHTSTNLFADTLPLSRTENIYLVKRQFPVKSFIIPTIFVMYGSFALMNQPLKSVDNGLQEEIWQDHIHRPVHIDTYLQFVPAISVYVLNAVNIHGENNFKDRSMIYILSNILLNTTIFSIKNLSHRQRPDISHHLSFPSGHTAEAFASAEFMRQEFKNVSPWYGISGYTAAIMTGYLRMYNNKHWFSDIVAGAGIGIASTKLAYWLYPKIQHAFFKNRHISTIAMPTFHDRSLGVTLIHQFRTGIISK